ncbi:nucleotide-binding universal stress UspA family protein [Saccharopolyspora lacisalsi]|uniref:Nucleotide-binding universal stress UspA family protein n=1 Tax=Halosaccharopolyspora lacisalsi TaxID=1000566 RepID=A0A839DST0_9PSEU|nr:universal stress protein [Halosaccharopolyspora lacisalsi]MBA8824564.1 nucleotide-binding universal stress UspA family protein [Halosaccharopolyspora lacisalsi]
MSETNKIVVGIDGSPSSMAALDWALGQAELTGASVEAITAWEYPAFYSWEGGAVPPREFEGAASVTVETTVESALEKRTTSTPVQTRVVQGHSAQILLEAAEQAGLLVVGSRGHGGFVGALLGSVSHKCAHHSPCPVVIVHANPTER